MDLPYILHCSLKDIFHERAWLKTDIFSVQVAQSLRFIVYVSFPRPLLWVLIVL